MMKKSALFATLLAIAVISIIFVKNNNTVDAFAQWKNEFGVPSEEAYRKIIFDKNFQRIQKHNADSSKSYKMGINQFSIFTQEEFKLRFLSEMIVPSGSPAVEIENFEMPNVEIDWTTRGGVSPIKNQGQCGSCWAFSTTGVLESWALISSRYVVSLSEQQLVDCSSSYGNYGCDGGYPLSALKYVYDHGISSQSQYPYAGRTGSCLRNGGDFRIRNANTAAGCNGMSDAITVKPLSVTVDASNWSSYRSGVFNNCAASINHAVLLVGVVGGAWKIKNSWGTSWGEAGYIRLAGGNTCGVCVYGGVWVA